MFRKKRTKLSDIRVVGDEQYLSTWQEIEGLIAELNTEFPEEYAEYITQFGEGVLGGCYIRVYPPHRILSELDAWRSRIDKYWFWDEGPCQKQVALESIIIGDTFDGDEILFHPNDLNRIFILPRHKEISYETGPKLTDTIQWLCSSGTLTKYFRERNFEPFTTKEKT